MLKLLQRYKLFNTTVQAVLDLLDITKCIVIGRLRHTDDTGQQPKASQDVATSGLCRYDRGRNTRCRHRLVLHLSMS